MKANGPKSSERPAMEVLSVLSTPFMKPYACQAATVAALRRAICRYSRVNRFSSSPAGPSIVLALGHGGGGPVVLEIGSEISRDGRVDHPPNTSSATYVASCRSSA